jgi:hypothetical protein
MADTWMDWLQGSPDRRLDDIEHQRAEYAKKVASPVWRALASRRDDAIMLPGGPVDPREARMAMVQNELLPRRSSDAWDAEAEAADYALAFGQRMRDTGLRAVQEAAQGNWGNSAKLAASTPFAGAVPSLSAGTPGSSDDWRPVARRSGVPEKYIFGFDVATDPEMWVTAPVRGPAAFIAPALPMALARAGARRGDDLIRALGRYTDSAIHGDGAATYLVDSAGETIRRLRNSPEVPAMSIEYAR